MSNAVQLYVAAVICHLFRKFGLSGPERKENRSINQSINVGCNAPTWNWLLWIEDKDCLSYIDTVVVMIFNMTIFLPFQSNRQSPDHRDVITFLKGVTAANDCHGM